MGKAKKPAAVRKAKKSATLEKVQKVVKQETRKPWVKILRTEAKKSNPRAYLHLIVPRGRFGNHRSDLDIFGKGHLTKEEAVNLREELCKKWGC